MRYVYDARLKPGARLTSVTVNGKALDDKQTYTLATSAYVASRRAMAIGFRGESADRAERWTTGSGRGDEAIQSVPSIAPKVDGSYAPDGAE
jgi:hypothetical protein